MLENEEKVKSGAFIDMDLEELNLKMSASTFADGSRIVPRITIQQGKNYIVWADNGLTELNYPNKILELYNNSSLHHSIIMMKAQQIAGDGLIVVDENHHKALETKEFIEKVNCDNDNLNDINKKIILDYEIFNAFASPLTFDKSFSIIKEIRHCEINKLRVQRPDEQGCINGYYYSFDWSNYRPKTFYYEKYDQKKYLEKGNYFNEVSERIIKNNDVEAVKKLQNFVSSGSTMLFYHKEYSPNSFYYPIPAYVAVIPCLEIDILSDIYATSSLKNGMDSGLIILIEGDSSTKEFQKTAKGILKSYAGARKAGSPVIVAVEDIQSPSVKIDGIKQENLSQKYRIINESTQQKILSGHNIPSSSLVGIQTAGKLGNTSDYSTAQELFFNSYVRPRQQVIEKFWNKIMTINNLAPVKILNTNVFNENKIESQNAGIKTENKDINQ